MATVRIGDVLQDRYRIVSRLAEGGMGIVYRAERIGLGRSVAVKFLHQSVAADATSRRRFEVEALAASRVAHPNCVAVIDFGVERGRPYLVMDYVEGKPLRDVMREKPLTVSRAADLGRQVTAGLAHAHGLGIIHRDIKPENIMVFSDGITEHARILDFGLAKLTGGSTITDGVAIGTPSYMSPEQTLGESADRRSDVYGLGVLLFELVTGKKPFKADNPFDVMRMHRETPVPSINAIAPHQTVSPELEAVIRQALAKKPDERFPTAVELAAALDDTPEIRRKRPPTESIAYPSVTQRPRWLIPAIAGGGLLVVGVVLWIVLRGGDSPSASATDAAVVTVGDASVDVVRVDDNTPPEQLPAIAQALEVSRSGRSDAAAEALELLRVRHPDNALVSYAIGRVNVDRAWWAPAVQAYADAIRKYPAYRTDARLIRDVVQALRSDKSHEQASALILKTLGTAAIEELDQAVRSGDPELRTRALRIRNRLEKPEQ